MTLGAGATSMRLRQHTHYLLRGQHTRRAQEEQSNQGDRYASVVSKRQSKRETMESLGDIEGESQEEGVKEGVPEGDTINPSDDVDEYLGLMDLR